MCLFAATGQGAGGARRDDHDTSHDMVVINAARDINIVVDLEVDVVHELGAPVRSRSCAYLPEMIAMYVQRHA